MEISNDTLEEIVNSAVTQAVELSMRNIDEKIVAAVQLGAKLGAISGAEAGAQAALRAAERERQKIRKSLYDTRFHNTKLLLRNYRALNEHFKHAVFDVSRAEAEDKSFTEIMNAMNSDIADEAFYIESIKQSCVRTKIIMAHVNQMLRVYEGMCRTSDKPDEARRWRILNSLYISDDTLTAEELAESEIIDKRTVYKIFDAAAADLTILLFGIAALEK